MHIDRSRGDSGACGPPYQLRAHMKYIETYMSKDSQRFVPPHTHFYGFSYNKNLQPFAACPGVKNHRHLHVVCYNEKRLLFFGWIYKIQFMFSQPHQQTLDLGFGANIVK